MLSIIDYLSLSNILLTVSIFLIIAGIPMSFSKKERERIQKRIMAELPERSVYTGSSGALKIAQRRGYITLAVGILLLILWFVLYGFGSLAIG